MYSEDQHVMSVAIARDQLRTFGRYGAVSDRDGALGQKDLVIREADEER